MQKTLTKQEILERVAKAKKMREAADYKPVVVSPFDKNRQCKNRQCITDTLADRIINPGYGEYYVIHGD